MDLSLNLTGTHVLITGGSGYIGTATVLAFLSANALVTSLDLKPPSQSQASNPHFQYLECDISSEPAITTAFATAAQKFGPIKCCVALASLDLSVLEHHESIADMSVEQWRRTHRVNVEGTFLTARAFLRQLRDRVGHLRESEKGAQGESKEEIDDDMKNVSLIIIGSESGTFGERGNADYAAGKSAVQGGLVQSLAGDIARVWPRGRYVASSYYYFFVRLLMGIASMPSRPARLTRCSSGEKSRRIQFSCGLMLKQRTFVGQKWSCRGSCKRLTW
jgi:NAD(P)-dependent dehydrogenase (short-subunit alcohol dehydrogenase family)